MKLKVFTVFDSKVEGYMSPFFMQSRGQALRAFGDVCNDKNTQMGMHPEDFTLFEVAEFDSDKGLFENLASKMSLGTGVEFVKDSIMGGTRGDELVKKHFKGSKEKGV